MASPRGRRARGRLRAVARAAVWERSRRAPPLKKLADQGGSITLTPDEVGAADPLGWTDAFFAANRLELSRLSIETHVSVERHRAVVVLTASDRLGAVPLHSPVTRKVAAGLLVYPRFGWTSVGQVLGDVGFRVEPDVGGSVLVPGSAREVPPWVLAGPVVARLAPLIERLTRAFVPVVQDRESPRGTVDWGWYSRRALPTGRWGSFRCHYSDLREDPELVSALRWTLQRVAQDLAPASDVVVVRRLLGRIELLLRRLGPGSVRRPGREYAVQPFASDWLRLALEAISWVRDERGLGGARALDGLPWSLPVSTLWEVWVESFLTRLTSRLGGRLSSAREGATRRSLVWQTATRTLGHLAPDFLLELPGRAIWVDAKYKDHLNRVRGSSWLNLDATTREAHRADFHQALAYAVLADAPRVDTILAYPEPSSRASAISAVAELSAPGRSVRICLASIPFGFSGPAQCHGALARWEDLLRLAA